MFSRRLPRFDPTHPTGIGSSWCRKVLSRSETQKEQGQPACFGTQPEGCHHEVFNLDTPPRLDVCRGPTLSDSLSDTGFLLSEPLTKKKGKKNAAADKFRYSFRSETSRPGSMIVVGGRK
ncbi:hypothetical protein Daesc_010400 [Daldinia eschscholtzii]|uniref:Uncharacterized protein n=1 Tax=Daldinia eschscholtzii TaxID=292717 RepID=A0AAX6M7J4_9PEZI